MARRWDTRSEVVTEGLDPAPGSKGGRSAHAV